MLKYSTVGRRSKTHFELDFKIITIRPEGDMNVLMLRHCTKNHKYDPLGGARGKVRGLLKLVGLLPRGS